MLARSDYPVSDALAKFAALGVEAAFLVPTATGLQKSILDAHVGVRDFLQRRGIHCFADQKQGQEYKAVIAIQMVSAEGLTTREMTLYRPMTKQGDPRIWISRLNDFVKPWNLLAIFADPNGNLFGINCSDPRVFGPVKNPFSGTGEAERAATDPPPTDWDLISASIAEDENQSPLVQLVREFPSGSVAEQLLEELRSVAERGWIKSLKAGDTGVGFTLEKLLGIEANSSRAPDYRGIELKAGRIPRAKRSAKQTLFAKTPDWANSSMNALDVLRQFGYQDSRGRLALKVTVSSRPNAQGLFLKFDESQAHLENLALGAEQRTVVKVVQWPYRWLEDALLAKHRETFWVKAKMRNVDDHEHFHYVEALHTKMPLVSHLAPLISEGRVTLDYTMHMKESGTAERNHGYLFRMNKADLPLLFPSPVRHLLSGD